MRSNSLGERFRITTFGESHGPAVGVVIDGVAPGLPIDEVAVQRALDRRRPGTSDLASPRAEPDRAEILSGVFEGRTTGTPLCILVRNRDARPADYETLKDVFRPGHADYAWLAKYGIRDWRGGGRASGRETIGRVAAGAVAMRLLADAGVRIVGSTVAVAGIRAVAHDEAQIDRNPLRCADAEAAVRMEAAVREARDAGDSVGGEVEVLAFGVPAGWGDPVFGKLDARLAQALMSIGGVKGVEVGDGFALTGLRGSEANDPIDPVGMRTNRAGGILGGISTGAPLVLRIAVKPTSSIARPQQTIDLAGRPREIEVKGRHDPCLCPRIVPVAEAMVACVLADAYLAQQAVAQEPAGLDGARAALDLADADLVAALARRFAIVEEIGRLKAARGGPVARPSREAEVRRRWARAAREEGLDREVASSILDAVLRASRDLQARRNAAPAGRRKR